MKVGVSHLLGNVVLHQHDSAESPLDTIGVGHGQVAPLIGWNNDDSFSRDLWQCVYAGAYL